MERVISVDLAISISLAHMWTVQKSTFCNSIAGFSFQSEGMTTLTNRSPRVYHCAALRTYLSQAHTCTSVHVPHFPTKMK